MALNAVQEFVGTSYEPDKLAVYDGAVTIDGGMSWLDEFEAAVSAGNVGHAMARMKKGMQHARNFAVLPASTHFMAGRTRGFHGSIPAAVKELVIAEYFRG
ncbi:hypothetical protein NFC73_07870 [Pseudarthrobacter sp. RMG13]|uniref:Uncharacterized protein n=1 Tax=Pseudarthrobacter humi TaxID=2952523 RepID=A0ABT1LMG3_9MICC|nr:hypothetical protein [Pseudarthrobacter humi]MCP8999648.1 hypothetical protein [Pseudarthrobacter humi]